MKNTERVNIIYKTIGAIAFSGGLLLLPVISFAQDGEDCSGGDPVNGTCPTPLDTWVIVLAATALIFTSIYLYRKQKKQNQAALKIKA